VLPHEQAPNPYITPEAEPMPILLFGEKYWRRIINFEAMVEEGVIAPKDLQLFRYVETPEAAWRAICAHYDLDPALADQAS
jgi:predicted Rossmann-fold nucleotide-binding protein